MSKDIMVTRWGGPVQITKSEVNSSNTASLDYYFFRNLARMGYKIHVFGQMSAKGKKVMEEDRSDDLYKSVVIHPEPVAEVPDYISHVFCIQGSENFRFGGCKNIPSQMWVYRLMRSCKVPFIYMQYDAYTPIFLPTEKRGYAAYVWGCSIKDLSDKYIMILHAGKNSQKIFDLYYSEFPENIECLGLDYDLHSMAVETITEKQKPFNKDAEKAICFIGKDRNHGSRKNDLLEIAKRILPDSGIYCPIQLFGKWKFDDNEIMDLSPSFQLKYNGTLPYGDENVINTYNKYRYARIQGNEKYKEFQQYTIRLFEVLASSAIPIFEREWLECWVDIFGDQKKLALSLSYNSLEEIPSLIKTIEFEHLENLSDVSHSLRSGIKEVISDEWISQSLKNILERSSFKSKGMTGQKSSIRTKHAINVFSNKLKNSNRKASRDCATSEFKRMMEDNLIDNYKDKASDIKRMREDFSFATAEYTDEELLKMFGR